MDKLDQIIKSHFISAFIRIAVFIITCIVIFTFIFGVKTVESNDMYPAVRAGDTVLFYRLAEPKNMDVVLYETEGGMNIGRVQAQSGDEIDVTAKDEILINGDIQPIQKRQGVFYETYARENIYPMLLGADEYFVLGDERDDAKDSRTYGAINKRNIKGKVFMTLRRRAI